MLLAHLFNFFFHDIPAEVRTRRYEGLDSQSSRNPSVPELKAGRYEYQLSQQFRLCYHLDFSLWNVRRYNSVNSYCRSKLSWLECAQEVSPGAHGASELD